MKVLVLLSRIPWPLEKGDKLRAYHHIKALSTRHKIVLVCLTDRKPHPEAIENLAPFCEEIHFIRLSKVGILWNLLKAWFNDKPFQVNYFYQKMARKRIDKIVERHMPRHIFAQLVRTAEYVRKYKIIPSTFDYMDAFSLGAQRRSTRSFPLLRHLLKLEAKRLKQYEASIFNDFTSRTIISKNDREMIDHPEKEDIIILPNGVDFDFFNPDLFDIEKDIDLLFTGNMNYPPNIEAAKYLANKIMPELSAKIPGINLVIAGANPHRSVKTLAAKNIRVTGWVNDIREMYARAKIFVAPMQIGSGMQNKILEAMAMKVPCITSSLAAGAIDASSNNHLKIADRPEEYIRHIDTLLHHPNEALKLTRGGYNFVKENYNWNKNNQILLDTIKDY